MPSIKLSTDSVHYLDQGERISFVLLHAHPGDSLDFEALMPVLARTHRVLCEFISALGLPPAVFIGNSIV